MHCELQGINAGDHVAPDPVRPNKLVDTVLDTSRNRDC